MLIATYRQQLLILLLCKHPDRIKIRWLKQIPILIICMIPYKKIVTLTKNTPKWRKCYAARKDESVNNYQYSPKIIEVIKNTNNTCCAEINKVNKNNKNTIDSNSACSTEAFILLRSELKWRYFALLCSIRLQKYAFLCSLLMKKCTISCSFENFLVSLQRKYICKRKEIVNIKYMSASIIPLKI